MREGGDTWTSRAVEALGGPAIEVQRAVHPRVRALLAHLGASSPADIEMSLEALARHVNLSPSRLMHAFTASIGVPLRPYLLWLRFQRAAGALAAGAPLAEAAHAAGFADAAHMTRTFRRTFGVSPSKLQRKRES